MEIYNGLDTLMSVKGLTSNEAFQAYYDQVLSSRENETLNISGFEAWDVPQIDFTYEQLEIENDIKVMATYVDLNSEAIPVGSKLGSVLRGSIPRQKARFIIGENDYRKQMMVLERINTAARLTGANASESAKAAISRILFGGLADLQDAHIGSLNYQVGQMKSAGAVTLTDANNPRGIQNVTFSAQVPTANVTTLATTKRWFTDAAKTTEGTASNPTQDIKDLISAAKDRYDDVILEVDEKSFLQDMKHSKWQIALGYIIMPTLLAGGKDATTDASAVAVTSASSDEVIKNAFIKFCGVPVMFSNTVCGVEKWNSDSKKLERTKLRAFNPDTYLARPSGALGSIKNVVPLRPDSSAISSLIFGGRGIIEYRYDSKHKTQDWGSELTVLAVPSRPKDMFYLHTK